jgi:hypothetical protein
MPGVYQCLTRNCLCSGSDSDEEEEETKAEAKEESGSGSDSSSSDDDEEEEKDDEEEEVCALVSNLAKPSFCTFSMSCFLVWRFLACFVRSPSCSFLLGRQVLGCC